MGVYDRSIETAKRLIKEKGDSCLWKSRGGGSHNVDICFVEQGNLVSELTAAFAPDSARSVGKSDAIMPVVPFTPRKGDLVVRSDGTELIVGSFSELKPGAQTILYFLSFSE